MNARKYFLLTLFLGGLFLFKTPATFAGAPSGYGQGSCSESTAICYTPTGDEKYSISPGLVCGKISGYIYSMKNVVGHVEIGCTPEGAPGDGSQDNTGTCCTPGNPVVTLPPHVPYYVGGYICDKYSVCYDGHYDANPSTGKACGNLSGWVMGGDGHGNVPWCNITGAICCDVKGSAEVTPYNPCPSQNGACTSFVTAIGTIDVTGLGSIVKTIFGLLLSLSGGIAVLLIIYSGYRIMIAQGDAEKIKEARETLTSAVIGLLFVIFSATILQIIGIDILHIPGFK